ncbi:MAG TPA: OmpA family protein [Candidatus Binatia bacterium]|nr:OmpA family protein [Candidatus Binatia bacterium]
MKTRTVQAVTLALSIGLAAQTSFAAPDQYDDSQSHPLRVLAYLTHPIGWLAEWTIFRPFHLLVSGTEPQEAFFGHTPHPPVLAEPQPWHNYGVAKKVPVQTARVAPPPPAPVPLPEHVKIVEVPVEKTVFQEKIVEREKIVEVDRLVFTPVAFDFDSARLTDLGKGQVYLAAQRLKERGNLTIAVEGHTDNRGDESYNQNLGLRRAQTVMNELASLGIDPSRMSSASIGESKPLIEQDTAWARAINRRVEFQVRAAK